MRFDQVYNKQEFLKFLKDFLPEDFTEREGDIVIDKKRYKQIKKATILGGSDSLGLQVLEMDHDNENDPRITIATDAFKILADHWIHKALIIFRSTNSKNFRLSLLTVSLDLNEKNKTIRQYSNARRYSFYLGPSSKINTPTKYLIKKGRVIDFEDLKNRFSLEVVNKDFYEEISRLFTKLVGGTFGYGKSKKEYDPLLELPFITAKSQTSLEFAVRLIGRVIFCWFLREKRSNVGHSLMPNELLSWQSAKENGDYYHKILEPIFFEVLNKPIKSRKEKYSNELFDSIPYLNGGLFSPHEDDYFSYNENKQASYHNMVKVPDVWIKEFFEFLETYNFTIDENIIFDEELSIDPEMLGRIFENLLAEINPETGESARKSTGSYYTPRTVVDYMVDESLFAYLKEKTKIDDKKIKAIISYDLVDDSQISLSDKEREYIISSLSNVKILDPACGSGAFPIGALQKIVFILQQIDPDGQKWFNNQIQNTVAELKRVIEREFANKNFDYIRKLGIIRENIFGVDIQPIATEISRLRCFLTLIVDEEIEDGLENRGIEPLPNLDFKFVTANSLIFLPNSSQTNLFQDQENIDELKGLRDQFFSSANAERHQLKDEFKELQKKMLMRMIEMRGGDELTQKLSMWDPFSHKVSPWFDPEWMFGIKGGFDIVIANPPYIDSEGMVKNNQEDLRKYIVENYEYTKGNWDIYIAFFEKGIKSLNNKGVLAYISPDKWISKPFGEALRVNTLKYLHSILNAGRNVFETVHVDSIVTIFQMTENPNIRVFKTINGAINFQREYNKKRIKPPHVLDFLFSDHLNLLEKIETYISSPPSIIYKCENACATSDAYKLAPLLQNLSAEDAESKEYLKIINTGTIGKYVSKWGQREMVYLGNKYLMPGVKRSKFMEEFENSYSKKSIEPKIIIKGLNLLDACLDESGEIIPGKSTLMIADKNSENLKLLLTLINSPLMFFYLKEKHPGASYNQGTSFTKDMINNLPIPKLSDLNRKKLIGLANQIITIKNKNEDSDTKNLESKINQLVYELYDLTAEEIKIVEND